MEDLKKIQEFFSKPLEEKKLTYNDFIRMVRDDMMAGAAPDEYPSDERVRKDAKYLYNRYLQGASVDDLFEADVPVSEDIPDIIAVDVPLFIRLLEFAREDAGDDIDLHEVAERAIEAVKARGVLSMDDYDTLIPPKEELNEDSTDDVNQMKIELAQKWLEKTPEHSNPNRGAIISFIQMAQKDKIQANKYWVDAKLSRILDPNGQLLREIIYNNIKETIQLGKNLNEELCPKGKAYIKKRMAAGEKSSAYLSGRAVKVCKGQMKG